jgi:hypothetical protein
LDDILGKERIEPMKKDWTSNRINREEVGETIESLNGPMYKTKHGYFFCDETWADSFGPFETIQECEQKLLDYAKTI